MTNLPPVSTLEIFMRNRMKDGWTREQVLHALKKRMAWDTINVDSLTPVSKARYPELAEFMRRLESAIHH